LELLIAGDLSKSQTTRFLTKESLTRSSSYFYNLVFNRTRKRILRELLGTNGGYLNRRNWWFKSHKLSNSSCWNEN